MTSDRPGISDKLLFIIVYPMFALFVVHIGNENSFKELLQIPSYYTDLLVALCCSFALGLYWQKLFGWMEREYPWDKEAGQRLIKQIFLGVLLPSFVAIGIESIYLYLLDIKLANSSILYLELPVILMLCLVINLTYIVLHYNSEVSGYRNALAGRNNGEHGQHFVVQSGRSFLNIPIDDVAYFKIQNKLNFLITQSGQSYLYDLPFKEISGKLPPKDFFQLNRQVIAKRGSILKSSPTDTRRLKIVLSPALDEPVYVAKTKASDFKAWFQQV